MIIRFSVSNFLSFKEPSTLSLVATALRDPDVNIDDVSFQLDGTNLQLLKSAVLLGANASGKSNFIKALHFFKEFVYNSFKGMQSSESIGIEPYRLNVTTAKEPSMMELVFSINDYIYRYGFEVTQERICKEWLYRKACKTRAKEIELYDREGDNYEIHYKYQQARELTDKKMIRDNALLLSTLAQFNEPIAVTIVHWLKDTSCLIEENASSTLKESLQYLDNPVIRRRIVAFSQFADLGIDNIEKLNDRLVSTHALYNDKGEKAGQAISPFEESESQGTLKYFTLAYPILNALDSGSRLIIDELGAKLHPLLLEHIVLLFNSQETNPHNAQLIFTTHDTNLLSAHIFRRDQVWFTQKDRYGASQLFSLAEYKVRSNASFERDYLQGKYGATPIMGNPAYALQLHDQ